jgi:hypothetical protein
MTAPVAVENLGQVFIYMTKVAAFHADSKTDFAARIASLPAAEQAAWRARRAADPRWITGERITVNTRRLAELIVLPANQDRQGQVVALIGHLKTDMRAMAEFQLAEFDQAQAEVETHGWAACLAALIASLTSTAINGPAAGHA